MSRIHQEIDLDARRCWTAFDPVTRHSFITSAAAANEHRTNLEYSRTTMLTGKAQQIRDVCMVMADVEGHPVHFLANVVDEVGRDANGREIEILFGSLDMRHWNIKFDLAAGRLDFTHFSHIFVEF